MSIRHWQHQNDSVILSIVEYYLQEVDNKKWILLKYGHKLYPYNLKIISAQIISNKSGITLISPRLIWPYPEEVADGTEND